jgi:SAM-dependent methyltransferase
MTNGDDQEAFWNEEAGPRWVVAQERLDQLFAPITTHLLDAAAAMETEQVVDVGCGCGTTTLALSERVGPAGSVLGVDISTPMLTLARERNHDSHVRFARADAATFKFEANSVDLIMSRFGVMFFADSTAAFANFRSALKGGGRCVFACWQSLDGNPWLSFPLVAAADLLPPLPPPVEAPGPFRFADQQRTTTMLRDAGFEAVSMDPLETEMAFSGSLDEIMSFFRQFGPASHHFGELEPADRDEAWRRVRTGVSQRYDGERATWPAASWIVRATA